MYVSSCFAVSGTGERRFEMEQRKTIKYESETTACIYEHFFCCAEQKEGVMENPGHIHGSREQQAAAATALDTAAANTPSTPTCMPRATNVVCKYHQG